VLVDHLMRNMHRVSAEIVIGFRHDDAPYFSHKHFVHSCLRGCALKAAVEVAMGVSCLAQNLPYLRQYLLAIGICFVI
jgi:hypothetical protein